MTNQADLGARAREVLIDISQKKDPTAIDRSFAEPFVQHDPKLADGVTGAGKRMPNHRIGQAHLERTTGFAAGTVPCHGYGERPGRFL
jgi:hypothetical protein